MVEPVELLELEGEQEQDLAQLLPALEGEQERAQLTGDIVESHAERRELVVRLHAWGDVADTPVGLETFEPGAFDEVDPASVVLVEPEHGAPAGVGVSLERRADAQYMVLRASRTARGDEVLELARDGVTRHVSVEYDPRHTRAVWKVLADGRRVVAITKAALRAVAPTYKPYYTQTAILAVRSQPTPKEVRMPETPTAEPVAVAAPQPLSNDSANGAGAQMLAALEAMGQRFDGRFAALEERARLNFEVPPTAATPAERQFSSGEWMQQVLRLLTGERIPQNEMRALADLITTDNAGVVPDAFSSELIGVIDNSRPFLESTRKLDTPATGMTLTLPKIITRPTVGIQAAEKDELTSTATAIDTVDFPAVTKGGAGDISIQLLKRSSPSFLSLYLELLGEAYAIDSDDEAVDALLAEADVVEGGSLDPEDASFGSTWQNSWTAMRRRPDTLWLSSAAAAAFIDAKADGTNQPLYANLVANLTAGGGLGGTISGLRPVHVPALDNEAVDMIVGPSNGFAWAEDGTFTLQVDVPSKAGRDVALVGILWFAPLYPGAFTTFTLAGG